MIVWPYLTCRLCKSNTKVDTSNLLVFFIHNVLVSSCPSYGHINTGSRSRASVRHDINKSHIFHLVVLIWCVESRKMSRKRHERENGSENKNVNAKIMMATQYHLATQSTRTMERKKIITPHIRNYKYIYIYKHIIWIVCIWCRKRRIIWHIYNFFLSLFCTTFNVLRHVIIMAFLCGLGYHYYY